MSAQPKQRKTRPMTAAPVAPAVPVYDFVPEWSPAFEGYAVNHITRHYWKIARTHTRDDAKQEIHFAFYDCVRRYGGKVENAAHFMSLFKLRLNSHWCDLAAAATVARAELGAFHDEESNEDLDVYAQRVGETHNAGELMHDIKNAPREVRTILSLFLNAPVELVEMAMSAWKGQGGRGKTAAGSNAHLNRMLGLPETTDPIGLVHNYFENGR